MDMETENPFYLTGIIPDRYFCDREAETQRMVQVLTGRAHLLLTSPRRMGKTQLIRHVYAQPEIAASHYTFYVDLYPTSSLHELALFMGKEIYSTLVPRGRSVLDRFLAALRSLQGAFGYDAATGMPSFDVRLGDIRQPELTLEEIFRYLESADRPCVFAIDEFQQIANYPERNVEALLRSHIQTMHNCSFIYAGSNRHVVEQMFYSSARPFYNSAEPLYLDPIRREVYTAFARDRFAQAGRALSPEAAAMAYDLFDGHTYYVHNLLHHTFARCAPGSEASVADVASVLDALLEEKGRFFAAALGQLSFQQKETLVAIAKEHQARAVTSMQFVRKHALRSPSSVQYALKSLLDLQLVTFETEGRAKAYSVADRFMEKWICNTY